MQFAIDIALSLIYFGAFLLLCAWTWRFWLMYKQQAHWNDIKWTMLEIKLPRNIEKSPMATELAISSLLQGGGLATRFARLFNGNLPQFASLEIASIEGIIHFYIRVQSRYRALVEANFYSQYPGIEIIEVEDYTRLVQYHHLSKDTEVWGSQFKLGESWKLYDYKEGKESSDSMPADYWPLKTYVDYGLDQNPKPEVAIDPIAPMLDFMGAIKKGEYFWFQIILTDAGNFNGKKWPKLYVKPNSHDRMNLMEMADEKKRIIRTAGVNKKGDVVKDEYGYKRQRQEGKDANGNPIMVDMTYQEEKVVSKKEMELTPDEKGMLDLINKKISKPLAVGTIRLMYIAKKGHFNGQNIFNILGWGKPFAGMNSFAPSPTHPYDYPWQDPKKHRVSWRSEEMFEAYVEREGLFAHIKERPWLDKWEDSIFWTSSMATRRTIRMFLELFLWPFEHPEPKNVSTYNLEEIATMWHLPGPYITTPTLPRLETTQGVTPVNLPQ